MSAPVELLEPWVDVEGCSQRINDMMRQSWLLLNEVGLLLNAGESSPEAFEKIGDLLAASLDIDAKVAEARVAECTEWLRGEVSEWSQANSSLSRQKW